MAEVVVTLSDVEEETRERFERIGVSVELQSGLILAEVEVNRSLSEQHPGVWYLVGGAVCDPGFKEHAEGEEGGQSGAR